MCRDSFLAGIMNLNCRSTNVWLYFPLSTIWFAFRAWLRCSEWRVKNDKNGGGGGGRGCSRDVSPRSKT